MCVIFIDVNNAASNDTYQLIAANNRDEVYTRPTHPAAWWDDTCISGLDAEPTKHLGTWFGFSTTGKVGCLLNILTPYREYPSKDRGRLVMDFISSSTDGQTFADQVLDEANLYRKFNLLLLMKKNGQWRINYINNDNGPFSRQLEPGIHGIGNSAYDKPWQKASYGKQQFFDIVQQYGRCSNERTLCEKLFGLLNDTTPRLPDTQLEHQGAELSQDALRERSALHVHSPDINFGTRTNTLLLIDSAGCGKYVERTRSELDGEWSTISHTFYLCGES